MDTIPLWLPFVFFLVAAVYSTVGFGGGSSYLAILALIGLSHVVIPQAALVCNLVVATGGVWHFHKQGHLDFRRVLPFVVLSIPMAFLGGTVPIERQLFMLLLGGSLFFAAVRMVLPENRVGAFTNLSVRATWIVGMLMGAALGFLSGVVGIGGGIFLAPVLIISGWGNARQTAGAAALFILVNSAAGLAGQVSKGVHMDMMLIPLVVAVLVGGQIGSRLGSHRLSVARVRHLLAALILFVSLRIVWGAI